MKLAIVLLALTTMAHAADKDKREIIPLTQSEQIEWSNANQLLDLDTRQLVIDQKQQANDKEEILRKHGLLSKPGNPEIIGSYILYTPPSVFTLGGPNWTTCNPAWVTTPSTGTVTIGTGVTY